MRRFFTLPLLMFLLVFNAGGQEFSEPFPFYVFDMPEAGGLFQHTLRYLQAMETGAIHEEDDVDNLINAAYVRDIDDYEMTSLFLRAYFREARNENIQQIVRKSFGRTIPDVESRAIDRMYRSEMTELEGDGTYQYRHPEGVFDEDIQFSRVMQMTSTDGTFSTFIPSAIWNSLSLSGSGKETFIAGGQTTSISLSIENDSYSSLPVIKADEAGIYDLSNFGVHAHNNADMTVLEFLEDRDNLFVFRLRLYLEESKQVYTLQYSYNISPININYGIFEQMKKHLLYYAFLSYIEA